MVQDHRQIDCFRDDLAYGQLAPAKVGGVYGDSFLGVYDPGNHQTHAPQPCTLRHLRSQVGNSLNGCSDDDVGAEVSRRRPLAASVLESGIVKGSSLDRCATDVHADDKIAMSRLLTLTLAHGGHRQGSSTERVRCRGWSGLSPLASASATANRCALIKSAIGSRLLFSTCAPVG